MLINKSYAGATALFMAKKMPLKKIGGMYFEYFDRCVIFTPVFRQAFAPLFQRHCISRSQKEFHHKPGEKQS